MYFENWWHNWSIKLQRPILKIYAHQNLLCCRNWGIGILPPQRHLSGHQQVHYKGTVLLLQHRCHQTSERAVNLAGGWNKLPSYRLQLEISDVRLLVKLMNCPVHWKIVSYYISFKSYLALERHVICTVCVLYKNPESVHIFSAWLPDPQIEECQTSVNTLVHDLRWSIT